MENRRSGRARRKRVIRPAGVADAQVKIEPVGLDLICDSCGQQIPSSRILENLHFYYSPDGPQGSPLKRCFVRCPNCSDVLVLGQNIGDEDKLVVIADATEYFAAAVIALIIRFPFFLPSLRACSIRFRAILLQVELGCLHKH